MKMKILAFVLFIIFFVTIFYGCMPYSYSGDYPELFTVAVNSMLGIEGFLLISEIKHPPKIGVLEEDEYGRILFAYSEGGVLYLIILQKFDDQYSYYYPDYNFVSVLLPSDGFFNEQVFNDVILNDFTEEVKQNLKEKNDWDNVYDESKCVKAKIVRIKTEPDVKIKEAAYERLFNKIAIEKGYTGYDRLFAFSYYCTSDDYGRMLYLAYGLRNFIHGNESTNDLQNSYLELVLIFNPDGTYNEETCVMVLNDYLNYQDELKVFKERNGWNMPYNNE